MKRPLFSVLAVLTVVALSALSAFAPTAQLRATQDLEAGRICWTVGGKTRCEIVNS